MSRPLALIGFSFLLALGAVNILGTSCAFAVLAVCLFLFVLYLSVRKCRRVRFLPPVCLAAAAACLLFIGSMEWAYRPAVALAGDAVSVTAELTSQPEERDGRFYYKARTITVNGEKRRAGIRFSTKECLEAKPYDLVSADMDLYTPGRGEESVARQYRAKGIYLSGYTVSGVSVQARDGYLLRRGIVEMRSWIQSAVLELLPGDPGAVLVSMLLGGSRLMQPEVVQNFRVAGVSHLFAVSGLHLSIWALLVQKLLRRARCPERLAALISAVFVIFFMALAGFTFSVVRAGLMLLVYLAGFLFRREPDSINSLGFAGLVIGFASPFAVLDVGLLLSFCATLGILLLSDPVTSCLGKPLGRIRWKPLYGLMSGIVEILGVTLPALLFTLPVGSMAFGSVSLIAPLGNLLMVSAAEIAMILTGVSVLLRASWIFAFLQYPLALAGGLFAKYLLWIADLLARMPLAVADTHGSFFVLWLAGALLLAAVAVVATKRGYVLYRLTAVLSAMILLVSTVFYQRNNLNTTVITVTDVGNGTAVLLSREGHGVLIGCGGSYDAPFRIKEAMWKRGIWTLDFCVIPRENDTESSALEPVLAQYPARELVIPAGGSFGFLQEQARVREAGMETIVLGQGCVLETAFSGGYSCALLTIGSLRTLLVFYPGSPIPAAWRNPDLLISRQALPANVQARFAVISGEEARALEIAHEYNADGLRCAATGGYGDISIRLEPNGKLRLGRER